MIIVKERKVVSSMMKKVYDFLLTINVWCLVLGAILTVVNSPVGSFVFLYTCVIGMLDAVKFHKNFNGMIINGTLGAMNLYYCICTLMG